MLTIKCARCKTKLFKYKKIGQGKVLRCYEKRIKRIYEAQVTDDQLLCGGCENTVGELVERGGRRHVKMNQMAFTFTGTKIGS